MQAPLWSRCPPSRPTIFRPSTWLVLPRHPCSNQARLRWASACLQAPFLAIDIAVTGRWRREW